MDAALAPLRLQGIRVLNYLDDWLILAHSRELVSRHRDIVLGHIHSLGLRMNAKKSVLLPSQRTVFLGVRLDSVQMQARLAPAQIPVLTACLARFKLGHHVSVGTCRRLLGLMAAASPVLPLGLLHMRPFLWWMKELRLHPTVPATRLIRVSRSCCRHLLMWRDPVFLQSGVRMGAIHRRHMITTDASMTGWGAVFEGRPASGEWKEGFLFWHINCLELRAVFLALKYFLPVLGLRMNAKKSVLLPSQRTVFLGVRLDSVQMQARLAPAQIPVLTACLARFKLGHHVAVGTCRRLLGLIGDTGSQVTTIPLSFYQDYLSNHPMKSLESLLEVEGANGQSVPYLGYVELTLTFPKEFLGVKAEVTTLALVVPDVMHVPQVLVGTNSLDALYANHAQENKGHLNPAFNGY